MFKTPKKAIHTPINRRRFLELGGAGATMLGTGSLAVGMNSMIMSSAVQAQSSDDAKWKQFSGSKLVFLSENTPPSFAIREKLTAFCCTTGRSSVRISTSIPVMS